MEWLVTLYHFGPIEACTLCQEVMVLKIVYFTMQLLKTFNFTLALTLTLLPMLVFQMKEVTQKNCSGSIGKNQVRGQPLVSIISTFWNPSSPFGIHRGKWYPEILGIYFKDRAAMDSILSQYLRLVFKIIPIYDLLWNF